MTDCCCNIDPEEYTTGPWRSTEMSFMGNNYYRIENEAGELVAVAYKLHDALTIAASPELLFSAESHVASFSAHNDGDFDRAAELIRQALETAAPAVLMAYGIEEVDIDDDEDATDDEVIETLSEEVAMLKDQLIASQRQVIELNGKLKSVAAAFTLVS